MSSENIAPTTSSENIAPKPAEKTVELGEKNCGGVIFDDSDDDNEMLGVKKMSKEQRKKFMKLLQSME